MITKTIFIYQDYESLPKFITLDGDYTRFDDIIINAVDTDEELSNEFCDLMYNQGSIELAEDTFPMVVFYDADPSEVAVIRVAFIP